MRAPNATVGGPHARRVAALKRLPKNVPLVKPNGKRGTEVKRNQDKLDEERKTLTERVAAGRGATFRKNIKPKATASF